MIRFVNLNELLTSGSVILNMGLFSIWCQICQQCMYETFLVSTVRLNKSISLDLSLDAWVFNQKNNGDILTKVPSVQFCRTQLSHLLFSFPFPTKPQKSHSPCFLIGSGSGALSGNRALIYSFLNFF